MNSRLRIALVAVCVALSAQTFAYKVEKGICRQSDAWSITAGWDNVNPDRKEFPAQQVLWTADLSAAKLELRDGAEGSVRVFETNGVRKLEIVKGNAAGFLLVTVPPFEAKADVKLRAFAFCECEDGDSEAGGAYLRLWGKKEDLSYFKALDIRRPGGPRMEKMVNTAPGTRIRKLAHRIADRKTGTDITAAIVVSGPPSTSLWSEWGVEDYDASVKAWDEQVVSAPRADYSAGMISDEELDRRLATEPDHTARVERSCGFVRLLVDGEPVPPVVFRGNYSTDGRNTFAGGLHEKEGLSLQCVPIRFGEVPGKKKGCWSKRGFDPKLAVETIRGAMRLAPASRFWLSLNLSAYPGFADEHPDEIWRLADGRAVFGGSEHIPFSLPKKKAAHHWNWISQYAPSWRSAITNNLTALVAELKRTGLSKRIVGIHFSGFHDGQFATRQPDFSAPAVAAFRDWQVRTSGAVKWENAPADFTDREFLDPDDPADAHRLAYIRFQKQGPFHVLEDFARHVKACFGKDILAIRYCMSWGAAAFNGALDLGPFLYGDAFDALVAQPSYTHRIPGVAIGLRMPLSSFHRNGKLFIHEFDLRTYGGSHGREDELFTQGLSKATDFPMWQSIHHKLAGQMIAQRMGWWYCDMSGAWYSPPEIVRDIGEVHRQVLGAEGAGETWRTWRPSVAVAIDEEGMLLRNSIAHYYALDEYAIQNQLRVLAGSGVPYESFVLRDFLKTPPKGYKVVFFVDVYRRDAARAKLIADLRAQGVTCVFADPKNPLSPQAFADLVRKAGGYVPARDGLQVDMNSGFISVHALKGGRYEFRLPAPGSVYNMKDGSFVANGDRFVLDVVAGETCWFRVGPYTPVAKDVPPIRAEEWKVRRAEVLKTFRDEVFGPFPASGETSFSSSGDRPCFGGTAIHRTGEVKSSNGLAFKVHAYWPKGAKEIPAFINIYLGQRWEKDRFDPESASPGGASFPIRRLLDRGCAAVTFRNFDVVPDEPSAQRNDCAAIAAWAWAASRTLDWVLAQPEIDGSRVAVVGHSRGGKTALWAGANDERFALVCANDSGCCGAKLNHVDLPQSEHFARLAEKKPYWFAPDFPSLAGRESELPFDQHMLLALVAPRRLAIGSASLDVNAGPSGEFLGALYASPAWEAYGKKGLVTPRAVIPAPETPLSEGRVTYHLRTGRHDLTAYDWDRYIDALIRN